MTCILENESLANLILTKLDDRRDIANFAEINKICNEVSTPCILNMKHEHFDHIYISIVFSLRQYLELVEIMRLPGNFCYYTDECYKHLDNVHELIHKNSFILAEFYPSIFDHLKILRNELDDYIHDTMYWNSLELAEYL
tara:strand:- start:2865 stop:3284 length:420 start_codon:yes stop_codon:yes gene_type:complete